MENKINYFCVTSSNSFKIMDNMHLALVNDHFQKSLGILEENSFGNFFQIFFEKIFPKTILMNVLVRILISNHQERCSR